MKVAYRFCLEALARTTLVRNDLLEGISLLKDDRGEESVSEVEGFEREIRGC